MRPIGFSTGALAKGDFRHGIELQRSHATAMELSALREGELQALVDAFSELTFEGLAYVSFHAPSKLFAMGQADLVEQLAKLRGRVDGIVVHPEVIWDFPAWRPIQDLLLLENMDQRKPGGRTVNDLARYFTELPEMRFCLDLGHARQIDPTMLLAIKLLEAFGDRLAELHLSEVDADSNHVPLSTSAVQAFRRIARLIPPDVPAIIESVLQPEAICEEIEMARAALGDEALIFPPLVLNP